MSKTVMCVLIISVFMGVSEASNLLSSQIHEPPSPPSEDKIVASRLNFWNRLGVIAKQVSLGKSEADHVRIMYLYRLDELEGNPEEGEPEEELRRRTIDFLVNQQQSMGADSTGESNEPLVFLVEKPNNTGDFVGMSISFASNPNQTESDSSRGVDWDHFVRAAKDVLNMLQMSTDDTPLYLATEQELAWLTPKSSVVFFDFNAPEVQRRASPITTIQY